MARTEFHGFSMPLCLSVLCSTSFVHLGRWPMRLSGGSPVHQGQAALASLLGTKLLRKWLALDLALDGSWRLFVSWRWSCSVKVQKNTSDWVLDSASSRDLVANSGLGCSCHFDMFHYWHLAWGPMIKILVPTQGLIFALSHRYHMTSYDVMWLC